MSWTILTAHRGATTPVRTHRTKSTAPLRSSRYHHAALAKIVQQTCGTREYSV